MKKFKIRCTPIFTDYSSAMTDQCFLLIVFFLVVASFVAAKGLALTLPDPSSKPVELTEAEAIVIALSKSSLAIDGNIVSTEEFPTALKKLIDDKLPLAIIIEVEPGITYGNVMKILETAKSCGAVTFSIHSTGDSLPIEIKGTGQ